MSDDITPGIVQVLSGSSVGTGFVVSKDGLLTTCAHVLGTPRPESVKVIFLANNEERIARLQPGWWGDVDAEDLAFLRIEGGLPQGVRPLALGSSSGLSGHIVSTYGFPFLGEIVGAAGSGTVLGLVKYEKTGQPLIQLRSNEITEGFSGGPVWDQLRRRVIGMVVTVAKPDRLGRMSETALATPSEILRKVCPILQISEECPYRSLDVFTEADAAYFFGRKRVIKDLLLSLKQEERCLAVLGPSGCGKSSVVRAGLIPQLRQGALLESDRWQIIVTRPFDDPLKQLMLKGLVNASTDLTGSVKSWLAQNPQQTRLVLVFDQFEELFVSCSEPVRQEFVMQLIRLIAGSLPVTVILAMRDDFYSHLAQYDILMKLLKQGLVNVPPVLERDELDAIVQKPAEIVGMHFEENLVETIVKDAMETNTLSSQARKGAANSTVLPLLEFALTQLWERPEDGMLTHKAYQIIGGVTGGLTRWGEKAYNELANDEQRRLARRIFTHLVFQVNESQGISYIRQRRPLNLLWRNSSEKENVQQIIRKLIDARLLVASEETVEIIHDALLREWRLLRRWLEEDRRFLEWYQKFQDRVQDWKTTHITDPTQRDKDALLRGRDLTESEEWLRDRPADLNQEERDFIQASLRHVKEEAQILRDLLEESERQRKLAEEQKQLAEQRRLEAEQQRIVAEQQREEAKRQQQVAEGQKQVALARQLIAQAELLRSQQASLLQRSVLLAVEAMQRSPSMEANQALRQGLAMLPRPVTRLLPRDGVTAATLSSDGHYLLTVDKYSSVEITEVTSGNLVSRLNHGAEVTKVAFSLDGHRAVTVGTDYSARIWETSNGQSLARLHSEADIKEVVLSDSGRYLAMISSDGRAGIWGEPAWQRPNPMTDRDLVNAVTFSLDGRYYATATMDCIARVWEISSGRLLASLTHSRSINDLAFSPDSRFLMTVSDDQSNYSTVRLWLWRAKGSIKPTLFSHEYPVNAVAFSPDGNFLATASKDQTARLWEIASGRPVNRMGHEGSVNAIVFSSDGRYLATTSEDRTVGVWETSSGYRLICLPHKDVGFKERDYIHTVAFSKDGRYFTTASSNGQAAVWEIINDRINHKKSVNAVAFSPDGRFLASASDDGTAGVWEVTNGRQHHQIVHEGKVWAVAFSPDGRYLATASRDGSVRLVDASNGRQLFKLSHGRNVNAVAFSPQGRYLATVSEDKTAKIWETSSGDQLFSLSHEESVYSVAFSKDGDLLVTACGDGTAQLWNTGSGRQLFSLAHKPYINNVAFSPDGRYLATASWNRTAKIWDVASGQELFLLSHSNKVWDVAFSHDSKCLATASEDGTARVWEMTGGQELLRLRHEGSVTVIAFSPDSQYLATASADRTARVWEMASGNQLAYLKHEGSVTAVAFSPDGMYLATSSGDGTARIWIWQSKNLIAEACARLTRNLTEVEWQQYIGDEPYQKTCPLL